MGDTVVYMRSSSPQEKEDPIDDQIIDDLQIYLALPAENFEYVLKTLQAAPVFLEVYQLRPLLSKSLGELNSQVISRVIHWLDRLKIDGYDFDEIIYSLSTVSLKDDQQSKLVFTDQQLSLLREQASEIYKRFSAIDRQHKAEELGRATGQRLLNLQLICDLRPIFDSARSKIEGLLPITTMHLTYEGADGLPNGVDVVLSLQDVERLYEATQFARTKLAALKHIAQKLDVPVPRTEMTHQAEGD